MQPASNIGVPICTSHPSLGIVISRYPSTMNKIKTMFYILKTDYFRLERFLNKHIRVVIKGMIPPLKKIPPKVSLFNSTVFELCIKSDPVTRSITKQKYSKIMWGFLFQNDMVGGSVMGNSRNWYSCELILSKLTILNEISSFLGMISGLQ